MGAGQRNASADPDELNAFYARFDCHDFNQTRCELMDRLAEIPVGEQGETLKVTKEEVLRELKRTNAGKAAGPDRMKPGLLKTCAQQLCSILCVIFNQSLSQCSIPAL